MSAQVFRLPDLGEGLTEAAIVSWLVAVGDEVRTDQPIAEVETAKSVVEVPSPFAGTVTALHGAAGDVVAVGSPFLEVGGAPAPDTTELEAHRAEERAGASEGSGNVLIGYGTSGGHATARTRKRRGSAASAPAAPPAPPAPPAPARSSGPIAVRSPIVRRLAQERGIDLRSVTPTGPDGVITRADLDGAATASAAPLAGARSEPLSMLRKAVAAKMTTSRREIPEATVWVDVDATELWELRLAMGKPSFTAILARFVVNALEAYPVFNARLSADGGSIEHPDGVHLGIATDTERGLLVPVVRHAERQSIEELDAAIRELGDAARAGSAQPDALSGSTFTLNNYGSLGVDGSAAIINHPEVAILGIGRMIERPWVVDGGVVPRRIATVSFVFDHRVADGGAAAGFVRHVVEAIERPLLAYRRL